MERCQIFTAFGKNYVVDMEDGNKISEEVCAALAKDGNHDPKFIDFIIKFIEIRDVDKQKTLDFLSKMIERLNNTSLRIVIFENKPKSKKILTRLIERFIKPRPVPRTEKPPHIIDAIRRLRELAAKVKEWEDCASIPHIC